METDQSIQKRFDKPWHFISKARKGPFNVLQEVFQNYHLDDLKQELQYWQQLALCNDQCAYDNGCAREDLMDFVQELQRLIEAFYMVNERKTKHRKRKQLKNLSKRTRQMLAKMNIPILLSDEEKKTPEDIIRQFSKKFHRSYALIELLDLLEAVVTYEGCKNVYKGQLVLFYQHLYLLTKLAYKMNQE